MLLRNCLHRCCSLSAGVSPEQNLQQRGSQDLLKVAGVTLKFFFVLKMWAEFSLYFCSMFVCIWLLAYLEVANGLLVFVWRSGRHERHY